MPTWMRNCIRDPKTAFATAVAVISVVGVLSGVIFIARILLALNRS